MVNGMDLEQFKEGQRRLWEAGDYRQIGRLLEPAARKLVELAGVTAGDDVLDIGVGSGNVTIAASETGANVVGIDITDVWWDEAHRRAGEAGQQLDLRIGDVEEIPFEDGIFDIVLSSFAAIFAPRHDVAAAEMVRVCRPGGLIGLNAWPPNGSSQRVLSPIFDRLPPGPSLAGANIDWGDPDYVRARFEPHEVEVTFSFQEIPVRFPSVDMHIEYLFANSGGFIVARETLEENGAWDEALAELRAEVEAMNEAAIGFESRWDYLTVLAHKT